MQNTCEGSKHFDFWVGRAKYLSWFLWGRGESMIVAERLSHLQYRLTCTSQPPFGLPCSNSPKPPTTPIWWRISFTLSVDHTTKYSHDFFAFSSWHFKWWGACPSALRGIQSLHPSGLQDYSGIPVVVLNYTVTNSSKDAAKVNYFVMTKFSHYIICLGCSTEQGLTVHYTHWL